MCRKFNVAIVPFLSCGELNGNEAAKWVAKKSAEEFARALNEGTAPALIRLLAKVAARFEIVVTEKSAAKALPFVGAVFGAAINAAFNDHYSAVARYHFGIRALGKSTGNKPFASTTLLPCLRQQPEFRVRNALWLIES